MDAPVGPVEDVVEVFWTVVVGDSVLVSVVVVIVVMMIVVSVYPRLLVNESQFIGKDLPQLLLCQSDCVSTLVYEMCTSVVSLVVLLIIVVGIST